MFLGLVQNNRDMCRYYLTMVKSCVLCLSVAVVTNILLLWSLLLWLRPSPDQWFSKHVSTTSRKDGVFVGRLPFSRTNLSRTLRILLWTPWFGDPDWSEDISRTFSSCPVSDCVLTKDKSHIVRADAVLFHAMDLWNSFMGYPLPRYRTQDQVWILYNFEPPPQSPLDFGKFDGIFNWTASYRNDSDIIIAPLRLERLSRRETLRSVGDVANTKSAGIAWVASNCGDDARRQMLVWEINKYFTVDTYGGCGEKELAKGEMDSVLRKYKFYLSFENSYCRDYITEKFSQALLRHNIPVVAGGGHYKTLAPPYSYIDVTDFNSVQDLAEYLKYLDTNTTAYNSYFEWAKYLRITNPFARRWCELCEALHDERRPSQVYTDMAGYIDDDTCHSWTLLGYVYRNIQGYSIKYGLV